MRRFPVALMVAAMTTAVHACAMSGPVASSGGSRDVLTEAELADAQHLDVYDAVRRLRPVWLRSQRGQDSLTPRAAARRGVRVYLDGVHFGDIDALRNLNVADVREIRHLDAREATQRYGIDHAEGAILVTTGRR